MIIDELISLLGFEIEPGSEATAAKYKQTITNVGLAVAGVVAGLGAAVTATAAFAVEQSKGIVESGKLADRLQMTFERLQELDYVAGQLNESSSELRSDLQHLNETMSSNIPGEYNKGLYMLGISARDASGKVKKVDEVLLEISDRMQGMDARKQQQFATMLGLSGASLALIQKGREGVAQLAQEARDLNIILDEAARVQAEKFSAAFNKTRAVAQGFAKALAVGLLPLLTEGLESITKWVIVNGEFVRGGIEQFITGAAEGFALFSDVAGTAWDWVVKLTEGFTELDGPLDATGAIALAVAIGIGAAAAALILANIPLLIMVAGITALVLVLEDLYNAFTGQPSLIGEWADSFTTAYPAIAGVLGKVWELIKNVAGFFGSGFIEAFSRGWSILKTLLASMVGGFDDLFTAINDILAGENVFEVLYDYAVKTWDRIKTFWSSAWGTLTEGWGDSIAAGLDVLIVVFESFAKKAANAVWTIIDTMLGGLPTLIGQALQLVSGSIKSAIGIDFDGIANLFNGASAAPSFVSPATGSAPLPAAAVASGGSGGATNNNTFNISGAGNPNAVADSVLSRGGFGSTVQTQTPGNRGPVMR